MTKICFEYITTMLNSSCWEKQKKPEEEIKFVFKA